MVKKRKIYIVELLTYVKMKTLKPLTAIVITAAALLTAGCGSKSDLQVKFGEYKGHKVKAGFSEKDGKQVIIYSNKGGCDVYGRDADNNNHFESTLLSGMRVQDDPITNYHNSVSAAEAYFSVWGKD